MQNIPGVGHIVGGVSGPVFLRNSRQNNDDLAREFKFLCGFDRDEIRSENKILKDFTRKLDAFRNYNEPAKFLAKAYLDELKKPNKEFNSAIYNFDKVFGCSSLRFQQEFFKQLDVLVKNEVNTEARKIIVPRDSIEDVRTRSPILDLAKQNSHVKKIVERELKDLTMHQPDRNNKLFLEKLIDQEESVVKTSSLGLVARHSEFASARSDKSKSKSKTETEREDFEYLKIIIKYLKLCKNGDVNAHSPEDNAQLNEIELQLNDFMSTFRDATNHISGGRIEKPLSIPSISVEASSSKPNRVAESRKAYSDIFFLSSQAFGEAENLMKQVRPTFCTSAEIASGIAGLKISQSEEFRLSSYSREVSRSSSQLDLTPTPRELSIEESKAFADYINKCNSASGQSHSIEIDSRNLAFAFEKIQKSHLTEQERSAFNKYHDIYIRESNAPSPLASRFSAISPQVSPLQKASSSRYNF